MTPKTDREIVVQQSFIRQTWTDGEEYTFSVNEADKEGLEFGDSVVMLATINSSYTNARIYGTVTDILESGRLTILIEKTVMV
ncbi:MAG: hypothetical protein SPL96_00300 [Bacteroidales bacterium]|nr:hypothetical protein [Bacteroidales bacterium]